MLGAGGRMGRALCAAVLADPALALCAAVDPAHDGELVEGTGLRMAGELDALGAGGAEVAVDFTVAAAAVANARWCAGHGVHLVLGTTGIGPADLDGLRAAFGAGTANCVMAPNFAIGAVLMMRFAELAAPWFETVEVVELHHDGKLDAPSGTALLTARRIAAARDRGRDGAAGAAGAPGEARAGAGAAAGQGPHARGEEAAPGVRVHSVRLRGLVAHQEVLFGTTGQTLTLRHDSLERTSFMPGVLLAVKKAPTTPGFTVGLESLLGL